MTWLLGLLRECLHVGLTEMAPTELGVVASAHWHLSDSGIGPSHPPALPIAGARHLH